MENKKSYRGHANDAEYLNKINDGTIYESNGFGQYEILSFEGVDFAYNRKVKVRFLLTGYEYVTLYLSAKNGCVRDPYYPKVCGVACIGLASSKENKRAYKVWSHMISRCYNINDGHYKNYGALGVKVCDRWLCFEYFLEDIKYLENYDKWLIDKNYQLDKDYKQFGLDPSQKIYSPETCIFISNTNNSYTSTLEHNLIYRNTTSIYTGVWKHNNSNNYTAELSIGKKYKLGTYTCQEAAAVIYNHFAIQNNKPINGNVFMTYEEALKYKVDSHGKFKPFDLYKITGKDIMEPWEAGYINKVLKCGYNPEAFK